MEAVHGILITCYYSARQIIEWKQRDINAILLGYDGTVYDSAYPAMRRALSIAELHELPLEDEDGNEISIYTDSGYKLQRRLARFSRNTKPHGILVDLRNLDSLFRQEDVDDLFDDEDQDITAVKYYVYPQAGLVTAGHFQSNGLLTPFQKLLEDLNTELQEETDNMNSAKRSPISGIACQAYNAVMHATRGRSAQHHDAQKGLITASLAGAWASHYTTQHTARKLKEKCDIRYPHNEFTQKISRDAISRDLRLENVFTIEIQKLPQRLRNGG